MDEAGIRNVKSILRHDSKLVWRMNDRKYTVLCVEFMVQVSLANKELENTASCMDRCTWKGQEHLEQNLHGFASCNFRKRQYK